MHKISELNVENFIIDLDTAKVLKKIDGLPGTSLDQYEEEELNREMKGKSYAVLKYFAENPQIILQHKKILEDVWSYDPAYFQNNDYNEDYSNDYEKLYPVISNIKGIHYAIKKSIKTISGIGYMYLGSQLKDIAVKAEETLNNPIDFNDTSKTESETLQSKSMYITSEEIKAIRAYSQILDDIEMLFMRPELMKFKPYFNENHNTLPKAEEDKELGIALCLRIRDGLQYSQALLAFMPEHYRNLHLNCKNRFMKAKLTEEALKKYTFQWELEDHPILNKDKVSVDSIVAYAKYWTNMGEVFLKPELTKLRKYFFENKDETPIEANDLDNLKSIAMLYNNAMNYSELLLCSIPDEFEESYRVFKDEIKEAKIYKLIDGRN